MILKARSDYEATCILRGLMTMGEGVRLVVVAPTFRTSKRIVEDLALDLPGAVVDRRATGVTVDAGGNRMTAVPVTTEGHRIRGLGPDGVIILKEEMSPAVLSALFRRLKIEGGVA
jgi:hypothetical protein